MNLNQQLKTYLEISPHVTDIARPLERLGIIGFFYIRIFKDGSYLDLASRPDWSEHYLRQLYANAYEPDSMSDHLFVDEGISLWVSNPHNPIWREGEDVFGYGNGISLSETHDDYQEVYCFYGSIENRAMNNFYINNIDYLKRFKQYFLENGQGLIQQAAANKFHLPAHMIQDPKGIESTLPQFVRMNPEKNYLEALTPKEIECVRLLAQGKTAREIGDEFCRSRRTIEHTISHAKSKLLCRTASELVYKAHRFGLV